MNEETIAAIATPPGEGGVAIIRISGPKAINVAEQLCSGRVSSYPSHTAHFCHFLDIDTGLVLVMRAPNSYTGEETVELQCHGGSLIAKQLLEATFNAGARPADPGEFTFRAYMNGKIDLAQAEAVAQLIGAKNKQAVQNAKLQLQGSLSKYISSFQQELTDIAAILEAWVDFPEEGLEFASFDEVIASLQAIQNKMIHLSSTFDQGRLLFDGITLCLAGAPNVGKSSLMNALLRKDRAIVTEIAGTTRDLLEEEMRIGNLHFKLIDTAGIRTDADRIEEEGIRRTKEAMVTADLILLVTDASRPLTNEEHALISSSPKEKTILISNKSDLPSTPLPNAVQLSAKTEDGITDLINAIENLIWKKGPPSKDEVIITSQRHKQALDEAINACSCLIKGLKEQTSPEFLTSDMRQMLGSLGKIIGTDITEEILSSIFSKFCVGK